MTNAENKQQVVDDKDVVEVIKAAIWANSTPDDCSIEAVERAMGEAAQAALKTLADNGYIITKDKQ